MNTRAITHAADATLADTMPFPGVVAKAISAGIEYYHVDIVAHCKTYLDVAAGRVVSSIRYRCGRALLL
jgi:hypothetical protein